MAVFCAFAHGMGSQIFEKIFWMGLGKYKVGDTATCGRCAIEHEIQDIKIHTGGVGYYLACGHRNAYCGKCERLVDDFTRNTDTVTPDCPFCSDL